MNQITDPDDEAEDAIGMSSGSSITGQKSGLKISILTLLKLSGKFLIGYFLIKKLDARSKQVLKFFDVLKYMENEIFGDAFYAVQTQQRPATLVAENGNGHSRKLQQQFLYFNM